MCAAQMPKDNLLASYEDVAEEYYDTTMHPTCASLGELSGAFILPRIASLSGNEKTLVEVGVGKSLLAPAWIARGGEANSLFLLDSSPTMLACSEEWGSLGVKLVVADALSLPFADSSVDVIVASLGDPYNLPKFWEEAARTLRPGGLALFTTPAHEWSLSFRPPHQRSSAEFLRRDGEVLLMPSPVLTEEQQAEMFAEAGLGLEESQSLSVAQLRTPPASKLLCVDEGVPVLRGYVVRKEAT